MSDQQEPSSVVRTYKYQLSEVANRVATKDLYLSTRLADVRFSFGLDGASEAANRIPAHKHLLAVVSDVFEKMFYGDLKETGDIAIVDVSNAAFTEFLQFFYRSEVELSAEHIAGVMYLGQKYNVESCVNACAEILKMHVADEDVCEVLALAILYEQKDLLTVCEKRILVNTAEIFQTAAFLECDGKVLAHILKMKLLSCSEVVVFEACMAWVRANSQQTNVSKAAVQKYLGDLYYEIRFASMTIQELCALEAKYSEVLRDDFHAIACTIAGRENDSVQFNSLPRQVEWDKTTPITCDRDLWESESQQCSLGIEEKTTFSTKQPLLLGRFTCNGIYNWKSDEHNLRSDLLVDVEVTEARSLGGANSKVLLKMTANLGIESTITSLPQPILIRPDLFYTICIKRFPEDFRFGSLELNSSMTLESDIEIRFHHDKVSNERVVGLIYELYFNKI